MKLLTLLVLASCSLAPPAPPEKPCIRMDEMQRRTEKVRELSKLMKDDTDLMTVLSRRTLALGDKFKRLSESFETASPQSLPKLQARREMLTEEAHENELEGQKIQARLKRLRQELDLELAELDESRAVCTTKAP